MMTAFSYKKEAAAEAGADDFISKPVDFTELAFRLKSIGRTRYLIDELANPGAE
jgi:DNA-binding response OmpR family regulator